MIDLPAVVLIPIRLRRWLAVVDLEVLLGILADVDTLDDALEIATIDTVDPRDTAHLTRVRSFMDTGDADAYWDAS